jgi:hypothetical protein
MTTIPSDLISSGAMIVFLGLLGCASWWLAKRIDRRGYEEAMRLGDFREFAMLPLLMVIVIILLLAWIGELYGGAAH